MKTVWVGTIAAILRAVVAGTVLDMTGEGSDVRYATGNVRL